MTETEAERLAREKAESDARVARDQEESNRRLAEDQKMIEEARRNNGG